MIITCPECNARYRLADDAIPSGGRSLRCASCAHRWFEAGAERAPAASPPEAPPVEPVATRAADPVPPSRTVLKTLFALVLSAAFTTGAVLLWVPDLPPLDVSRVPWLARLVDPPPPPRSPVRVGFSVDRQPVAGGRTLFALTGTLENPTAAMQTIPLIEGRLADASGTVAYRWRIAPPVAALPPGSRVRFEASAIGDGSDQVVVALLAG